MPRSSPKPSAIFSIAGGKAFRATCSSPTGIRNGPPIQLEFFPGLARWWWALGGTGGKISGQITKKINGTRHDAHEPG
jgi:hypothetical protein